MHEEDLVHPPEEHAEHQHASSARLAFVYPSKRHPPVASTAEDVSEADGGARDGAQEEHQAERLVEEGIKWTKVGEHRECCGHAAHRTWVPGKVQHRALPQAELQVRSEAVL